ncbi:hypothetical protein NQ315_001078 [Exocentrus adspersus]|uniref:Uncharacterized protein n=1 Tax=Exocentrus adspersus TaxID=1586481 RepID=A0AAV8WFC0_9CUCU|nr:hypothetical protein NQ315_001078 [Exocentrus adspersus]
MAGVNNMLETVREDDFVEYFLFPAIEARNETEEETLLSSILDKANKIVKKYADDYLWHKDEFRLSPRTSIHNKLSHIDGVKENLPPHLYGVSHYGDNIEDEWFIVYILQQLTKEINGLIARVHDADGEFILIEAADALPRWASPETCENRVFICDANIHLVAPDSVDEEDYAISVKEAVSQVREKPTETVASIEVQNAIKDKLSGYPEKAKENVHRATIYVPVAIAAILKHKPTLIAFAVQAFCNRDPIDTKACRAMKYFPPENRVLTSVTFTKCMYAMLMHSNYMPDRRTGWNLPPPHSPSFKAHLLGVKVACGFEILATQAKPSADIETDRGWHSYLKSLTDKGYFKGLLEHSIEHNNLLNKAKEYYVDHRDSMHYSPVVGQEILQLTKTLDYSVDELKRQEQNLPKDDDDAWLNITPEELDKMLQEKYGQKTMLSVNNNSDAAEFTERVTNFLNHVSGMEGVEFPDEDPTPVRPPRRKNKTKVSFSQDTKPEPTPVNNKVNFDPNSFACAVQNILNFVIPEDDSWNLESDSDMSEYEEDNYVKDESYQEVKNKMQQYMEEMDKELAATTIGDSFVKKNGDSFDDVENFTPVDINVNALKNILESYRSQLGEAGPSSNMLGPMGVHLEPRNSGGNAN